ncbi:tetratricopeptide repeat protein [Kordia sp.]|uniref:tetratricopeptide repeat protein n=1 Tax=Kordia sp. TaxID=1965332 RepID=UPI003B5D04EB
MFLQKYAAVIFFIFSFCIVGQLFAQDNLQDPIHKFNEKEFIVSLQKLKPKEFARLFARQYSQDSTKSKLSVAYIKNMMISSEDLETQFWGYNSLAKWERNKMNLEPSIAYLDSTYTIAKTLNNDDLIMSSLINKGVYYYDFGFYKKAMEYYLEVLKIAKKADNRARQLAVMQNIALLKLEVNDRKGAIKLLEESLKIVENEKTLNFNYIHVNIYIALSKANIGIENYEKAASYCYKGIELSEKFNDKGASVYFYNFLGEIANSNGNYEEANNYLDKAVEITKRDENTLIQLPLIKLNKAKMHYFQKNYNVAIEILLDIESREKLNGTDIIYLEEVYVLLAKSYKEINDTENSLKYYEKASEIYKENDKIQESLSAEIIKKYDLETLKEELDQSQEDSKRTKYVLYISAFLTIGIIVSLIFFYKNREKNNQRKFAEILKNLEREKNEIAEKINTTEPASIVIEVKEKAETNIAQEVKEVEILDETKERLLKKLQNFETKELFLSKNSSLNEVAKKLKTNTSYLSKLVNAHKGKSFTAYITDLRVNYAIRRLKEDKKFRSYTIDSIAREIGFNRSESFSRAFKNKTGLYPSYYVKNLDNQNVE